MTNRSGGDHSYGQLGECIYDTETRSWIWNRELGRSCSFHPIGNSSISISPPKPTSSHEASNESTGALDALSTHLANIDSLSSAIPEIGTVTDLLASDAQISQSVERHCAQYDPIHGDCLAFGTVRDSDNRSPRLVAAFPGNQAGTVLRLVQLQRQRQGWQSDRSIWLSVPVLHGETGQWDAASPIQQVVFCNDVDGERTLLAVRTLRGTTILAPRFRQEVMRDLGDESFGTSRLEIAPLCLIPTDSEARSFHVDVAFNPWYPRQFAVIDKTGSWCVREVRYNTVQHSSEDMEVVRRGNLEPSIQETAYQEYSSGCNVLWIANASTILVCNGLTLVSYDLLSDASKQLTSKLDVGDSSTVILDMKMDPVHQDRILVLTSTRLFVLHISIESEFDKLSTDCLVKLLHFRDPQDPSLRIDTCVRGDVVTLRSSANALVTLYRLSPLTLAGDYRHDLVSISDAALLHPPLTTDPVSVGSARSMALFAVNFVEHHSLPKPPNSVGDGYQNDGVQFWASVVLLRDFTITQQLYCSFDKSVRGLSRSEDIQPLSWRGRILQSTSRLRGRAFIVENDEDEDDSGAERSLVRSSLLPRVSNVVSKHVSIRDTWDLDFSAKYAALASNMSEADTDIRTLLERLGVTSSPSANAPLRPALLSTFATGAITIQDIDNESAEAERRINASRDGSGSDSKDIVPVSHMKTLRLSSSRDGLNLSAVYDDAIANWLSPLARQVPARTRQVKEQLARQVAADVYTASYVVKPSTSSDSQSTTEAGAHATDETSGSQTLSALDRLGQYTHFATLQPAPQPLSSHSLGILAHWDVGTDVNEYDWLATKQRLERDEAEEQSDQGVGAKERARMKRRADRRLQLLRSRESAKAKAEALASSQAPQIVSASQSGPGLAKQMGAGRARQLVMLGGSQPLVAGSSQSESQSQGQGQGKGAGAAASQIEAGRFGGRAPPKKKRRTQGF